MMTRHFLLPSHETNSMSGMLVEAVRCWRDARDKDQPAQPNLFALLSRYGHGILAPAFDSVMRLAEGAFGKRITTGRGQVLSVDERRLIDLIRAGGAPPAGDGLVASFHCAVTSLRILLTHSGAAHSAPAA